MEPEFTEREKQVAGLIALGRTNKEIGKALEISVETVKEHVGHALHKSRAKTRVQLAVWWVLRKLSDRQPGYVPVLAMLDQLEQGFHPAEVVGG